MNTRSAELCPQCGAPVPEASEHGLCPRCVFAKAMQPTVDGDSPAPAPPDLEEVRAAFPQLEIVELIGRGGMGSVFKARQPQLDRFVALKILPSDLAGQTGFSERFQREAQALAKLSHPHIVAVHDFGQSGGFYYLLMEFVDGVNLRQLLRAKRLTPKEALSIVPPICDALQCAHERGIVHRDIKPENLLIDKMGVVKIADFGIAKIIARPSEESESGAAADSPSIGTLPLGTPDYAAPEQRELRGDVDHRADIYSLGVVLYEMLTGERPKEKIEAPSKRVQVDIRIDDIVLRALEREPELRFHTAAEFRTQVETVATDPRTGAPASTETKKRGKSFGRIALALCLFGLVVPAAVLWRLQPTPGWALGRGILVIGGVCEIAALACGIADWKSRGGKAAVIVTGLLLLLLLPAAFISPIVARERAAGRSHISPEIESVEANRDEAVVKQRYYDSEGMLITFGSAGHRWTPKSVYLEAMFDINLESRWFSPGVSWRVKTRHGIYMHYRLEGPAGSMDGKIVFRPGTLPPETDGAYVIGDFQPSDGGAPLPIAVKLEKDHPTAPSSDAAS